MAIRAEPPPSPKPQVPTPSPPSPPTLKAAPPPGEGSTNKQASQRAPRFTRGGGGGRVGRGWVGVVVGWKGRARGGGRDGGRSAPAGRGAASPFSALQRLPGWAGAGVVSTPPGEGEPS